MKFLLSLLTCLALVVPAAFGQSTEKLQAAFDTVTNKNSAPVPVAAGVAFGLVDPNGNVLANGKTGTLALAANTSIGGSAVVALGTITSNSANAFAVGRLGATTPAFNVDASTASSITGFNVKSAGTGGGVALKAIGETNVAMKLDSAGSGTLSLNVTGTGAIVAGRTLTLSDPTTPSVTTAAGKTNTGYVGLNGKTNGQFKITTADSTAQTVTLSAAAQTVGAATATLPDLAGVSASLSLNSTATLTAGATPAFIPKAAISTYLLTPGEGETIAGTTTGAVAGKVYYIRILTSGTMSYTITFGANFVSTGTLATGTADAKTFVIGFLYDGTNFCEVSRTTAM